MNRNNTQVDIARINDSEYIYKVFISNSNGKFTKLSQSAVKNLTIVEEIFSPYVDATMVIDDSSNVLQRGYSINGEDVSPSFEFNTGEIDFVYVEIIPKFFPKQQIGDMANTIWNLKFSFVIDNIEEISVDDPELKYKKLYLLDADKELANRSSKFSTAKYVRTDVPEYSQDNEDRMLKTGVALRELLNEHLVSPTFSEIWDDGSNDIFYTSPIGHSYGDDLMHLCDIHQSSVDNDFCILSKQRYTEQWTLEKFSSIAEKALDQSNKTKSGEYQSEAFVVAEAGTTKKIPKSYRVPTDYGISRNISFGDFSKLEQYNIVEIANGDSTEFLKTTIAHSYDFDEGKFRIEHYDISDMKNDFRSRYAEKLRLGNFESSNVFQVGEVESQNENVRHVYASLPKTENTLEFVSRNKVFKSAYLLSVGIDFTVPGMTCRQSGKFFSIRRENEYVSSEFENKLQGQWFCVRVEHVFSESSYSNNIVGVKLNKLEQKD